MCIKPFPFMKQTPKPSKQYKLLTCQEYQWKIKFKHTILVCILVWICDIQKHVIECDQKLRSVELPKCSKKFKFGK